jgi:hypothetical protein
MSKLHLKCYQTENNLKLRLDSLVGFALVSGAVARPTASTEPCVKLSLHTAPQHTSPCYWHSIGSDCSLPELGTCAVRVGLASGLQYARTPCVRWRPPKTQTLSAPMPSRVPAPRQRISGITRSISFLGHPSHQGIRPGRLLQRHLPLSRRAIDGLLRSVCPFSVTLGRHCTPRPSHRVNTTHLAIAWPNGAVSLLGLPISRLAGSNSRRLRVFVEHPDHSHLLEASPLSASCLSPFTPCTPTFDSQSPAAG